jgi:hypothetical protein
MQIVVDWKHQDLSEVLDNAFTKIYSPCEPLNGSAEGDLFPDSYFSTNHLA